MLHHAVNNRSTNGRRHRESQSAHRRHGRLAIYSGSRQSVNTGCLGEGRRHVSPLHLTIMQHSGACEARRNSAHNAPGMLALCFLRALESRKWTVGSPVRLATTTAPPAHLMPVRCRTMRAVRSSLMAVTLEDGVISLWADFPVVFQSVITPL